MRRQGQLYKPVDSDVLMYYKEAQNGQILEEGITEAGLDGVLHGRRHGLRQSRRADDSVLHLLLDVRVPARRRPRSGRLPIRAAKASWSAVLPAARRCSARACSIRTGIARFWPARSRPARSYDPAFAYEIAVIVQDGIRRMYESGEDHFYYLTVCNENYVQPPMPEGDIREGILRGMYPYKRAENGHGAGDAVRQRSHLQRGLEGAGRSWPRSTASAPTFGA